MCARKITPAERSTLDLSNWKVAFNGAEPVRADTLKRFAATFASCGFQPKFFYPCYGLAEATLIVAGGLVLDEPILCATNVTALEHNRAVETPGPQSNVRELVGCGQAMQDTEVVIVHPESLIACADDEVGEIWVSGPSVAEGYWNRPEETKFTFESYLSNNGEGPFLRTGDLGFLRGGELFVTGRLKDLIIIGGRNLYPHDIELTVEQSHELIRPGGCVAFPAEVAGEERLVIAVEVERRYRMADRSHEDSETGSHPQGRPQLDADALSRAIRRAVAEEYDVRVHAVVLLKAGTLPKTPSGKIQRRICEARYRDGELEHCSKNEE
jgi:acyl-CoA synthetase (AMP-forming)/AMP-acid ligase II